jgi:hypothetical protein
MVPPVRSAGIIPSALAALLLAQASYAAAAETSPAGAGPADQTAIAAAARATDAPPATAAASSTPVPASPALADPAPAPPAIIDKSPAQPAISSPTPAPPATSVETPSAPTDTVDESAPPAAAAASSPEAAPAGPSDTVDESPAPAAAGTNSPETAPAIPAADSSLPPTPAPTDAAHPVRVAIDLGADTRWELVRVEVLLDGRRLRSAEPSTGTSAAHPVWSGVVAPGPHNLAALLFFRPRAPAGANAVPTRAIRIEKQHRFSQRPIRPLVLLITPSRPAPPSEPPAVHFAVADPSLETTRPLR